MEHDDAIKTYSGDYVVNHKARGCYGKGIMSSGFSTRSGWSDCSRTDFIAYYNNFMEGFGGLA